METPKKTLKPDRSIQTRTFSIDYSEVNMHSNVVYDEMMSHSSKAPKNATSACHVTDISSRAEVRTHHNAFEELSGSSCD